MTAVSAVRFRQDAGALLNHVRERGEAVVISEDGKAVAALVDAELFARIRRMQGRFDKVSRRLALAYADVPEDVGMAEINSLVPQVRAG